MHENEAQVQEVGTHLQYRRKESMAESRENVWYVDCGEGEGAWENNQENPKLDETSRVYTFRVPRAEIHRECRV